MSYTSLLLGLWVAFLGFRLTHCGLVTTTSQLFAALSDPTVTDILLSDSLAINGADWGGTVNITRNVLLSATSERLASKTYVLLDFKGVAMMFQIMPGLTMTFSGLELVNHYDTVGPSFRPLHMSLGATALFDNCVQIRRAGLPYKAALVNMVTATRPSGVSGPQVCTLLANYTYRSTRSAAPIQVPQVVNMYDYATTVAPDSSLAYQGLYYGGYTYVILRSHYYVQNFVSDDCLQRRPGTECVTLLLQQLDGQAPPPPAPAGEGASSSSADTTVIVVATVVPVVVVLAAAAATVLLVRRRNRGRQLTDAGSAVTSGGGDGEAAGKGRTPSSLAPGHDSGCIFMGLEENQKLPEWSPLAADVEEDEVEDEDRRRRTIGGLSGLVSEPEAQRLEAQQEQQQRRQLGASASDATSCAPTCGLLRPALSTQILDEAAGGGAGGGSVAAAAGRKGEGRGGAAPSSGALSERPAEPDMLAELGRMAQELRASVKDEAIKLEAIIGCGSFGTVYKGTWQGLPVAVKTLVFSASDESRRRALQEAALCASITHPNVVATYSSDLQPLSSLGAAPTTAGSADAANKSSGGGERELSQILEWRLYIVQEYADGGPLRKLYGNRALWPAPGVVNMPAVVGLALGITRALSHLHAKRIIHGDLNPNNVLLKRDDGEPSGFIIKVGDFGLSVMLPQNQTHLSNLRMGTMFYMCPAVVMKGQVGPSSDVFSLGVMLWELYHGRRAGIRTEQGPRYSSIFPAFPPTCPDTYRAVALHCLQRQPQNRPPATLVEAHLDSLLASLRADVQAGAAGPAVGGGGAPHGSSAGGGGSGALRREEGAGTGTSGAELSLEHPTASQLV